MTAARKLEPRDAAAVAVEVLPPLSTKKQVAEFRGVSVPYVTRLITDGRLQCFKFGDTKQADVRISRQHVANYLRSCER